MYIAFAHLVRKTLELKCTTVGTKAVTEQSSGGGGGRRGRGRQCGNGSNNSCSPSGAPEPDKKKKIHFSFCPQHILLAVSPPLVGGLMDCVAQNFNFGPVSVKKWFFGRGEAENPPPPR